MGYNIYVTKSGSWSDPKNSFSEAEWKSFLASYKDIDSVYFQSGMIAIKNPSESQLISFVKAAKQNGWIVQGDDGESYDEQGRVIYAPKVRTGFFIAIVNAVRELFIKRRIRVSMAGATCPFRVGDRVHTIFRSGGEVIEVDPEGNHGNGSIKVKFPDGEVIGGWFVGHGFEKEV